MQYFVSQWKALMSDPKILDIISHCHIEFGEFPTQKRWSAVTHLENKFSDQERVIIDAQVAEFLSKGILSYSESQDDQIISPIFFRPKPDGTYRVIFNLKALNDSVVYHHFKLDTLEVTLPLITPGCYMTSLDLKDAYYSIPIAPQHQRFLKFIWKGVLYQFRCLPMGLTSSPRIFTKALKPVFAYLRGQCGISCASYIDDSLYLGDTYETCIMNTLTAVQLFISLGFQVHPKKSMVVPTQKIEYLGFVVSSIDMTVRLTEEKVSAIIKRCRDFSRVNKEHSIREVASLVGTLISTFPGVQYGPLHYRSLDRDKMDALKRCKGDYEAYMVLSPESLGELSWWITHMDSSVRKIMREDPHSILETDASLTGWGAKWGEMKTQGVWCRSEKDQHINCLELLAIRWGLLSLCHAEHDTHIRIMSDNVTAVCYINAMGGCQSDICNRIACDIWQWAIEKSIWLSAAHTPGTGNCEADELSRKFNPNLEWSVTDEVFNQILKVFALGPTIDLFASRVNAKLPAYVSWKADPFARYVDAFTLNWASHTFYAFPPFVLVSRCLSKVRGDGATGILIVPMWPTQSYFASLLSMLVDMPRYFKATRKALTNPLLGEQRHPLQVTLLVCRVSGNPLLSMEFRHKLPTSSCPLGDRVQLNNMMCSSTNGPHFVCQGNTLLCVPLFH